MAEIRAFRGSRFAAEAGDLARLLAPPAETISPQERERLAAEGNNIVHATLPPAESDDRSKYVRYARASAQLSGWRRAKLLLSDPTPALYLATTECGGESCATLLALAKASDLRTEGGDPVPVKDREDRLRLLEATRTHLEPVLATLDDPLFSKMLEAAPTEPLVRTTMADGTWLGLDAITDPVAVEDIEQFGSRHPVSVVGGFAKVEAARAFRSSLGERSASVPEDYLLLALAPSASPSVSLLPSGLVLWSLGEFA